MNLRARDAALRQHRLRAARPRPRARRASPTPPRRWASRPSSTATRPRGSAASRAASRRSRWRTPTRRSPPAGSATSRSRSRKVEVPRRRRRGPRQAQARARVLGRRRLRGDEDPQAERPAAAPARAANIGCPAAGKTGTTDNFNDAWFVGYTPHLATAVWVGYPDALREMRSVHGISVAGGTFPAEIWNKFMQVAKGRQLQRLPAPDEHDQLVAVLRQVLDRAAAADYTRSSGSDSYDYGGLHGRRLPAATTRVSTAAAQRRRQPAVTPVAADGGGTGGGTAAAAAAPAHGG